MSFSTCFFVICTNVVFIYYIYIPILAVLATQQQHKEKTVTTEEDDTCTKRPTSPSTDADVPLPTKTVETDDASDDDLKKCQEKESKHGDIMLDKSVEPVVDGKSVVSEENIKEDSKVVSQSKKSEVVTSTTTTVQQQPGTLYAYHVYIQMYKFLQVQS